MTETEEREPSDPGLASSKPAQAAVPRAPGIAETWLRIVSSPRTFFGQGHPLPSRANPLLAATIWGALGFAAYLALAGTRDKTLDERLGAPGATVVINALGGLVLGALLAIPSVYVGGAAVHWAVRRYGGRAEFRVARDIVAYVSALDVFLAVPGGLWLVPLASLVLLVIAIRGAYPGASAIKAVIVLFLVVNLPFALVVGWFASPIQYAAIPIDEDTMALSDEEQGYLLLPNLWRQEPRYGEVWAYQIPPEAPSERAHSDPELLTAPKAKPHLGRVVGGSDDVVEIERGRLKINQWQVPTCHVGTLDSDPRLEVFVEFLRGQAYLVVMPESKRSATHMFTVREKGGFILLGDNRARMFDALSADKVLVEIAGRNILDSSVWNVTQPGPRTILGVPRLPPQYAELFLNGSQARPNLRRCLDKPPPRAATLPPKMKWLGR